MDTRQALFETIGRRFDDLEMQVSEPDRRCQYAQPFYDWAVRTLHFGQEPSIVSVNQAKVLLIDKYFDGFSIAPRQHRYHLSPNGHTCIFHVFVQLYQQLRAIELSLTPPMLFIPPPPPPPPQIAGIFVGEKE